MKVSSTFINNKKYLKGVRSVEKIKSSSKLNLSIMDEKLSLLNSDIEDLYKKYVEKKKLRRRKEKSEQSLASRINFLIDEERKIRNQIENKIIKNHRCSKNRSVKALRTPEIVTNSGTIRYNTIESSDNNSPRNGKFRINSIKYIKKNHITKYNKIDKGYDESNLKKKQFEEMIKKNGINDITLSSIQNNSSIDNNNITIGNRSNVTNNVCIIINNSDKSSSKDNIKNNNFNYHDISFAEKENNFKIDFKINDSMNANGSNKLKQNILINDYSDKKENENRINNEINYIKMSLASKLNDESFQTICQTYHQKEEISLNNQNKKNLYINEMTERKENARNYLPEYFENNLKTPSFKQNGNKENKKIKNKSLKEILNIKQKKLENEKEFNMINSKKRNRSVENIKIKNNKVNNNKFNKKANQRCFSKPNNSIKSKNKMIKAFNHNNIKTNPNPNKSQIINKITYLKKKINKEEENKYNDLSIDSDEIILSDEKINISKKIKQTKNKKKKNYIAFNKYNDINNEQTKKEKMHHEYGSTPNLFATSNLTFNQSIEKKRKLLGIPLNLKENYIKKTEKVAQTRKNINNSKEKEIKYLKKNDKNENKQKIKIQQKSWNRNIVNNNKPSKTNDNKKKNIKTTNKKEINLNDINSPYKEIGNENDYSYKNYDTHNSDIYKQLFNSNNKKSIFANKENNHNIASTSSLASFFSTQTNKSNKKKVTLFRNKNSDYEYNSKSNNNIAYISKLKKNIQNPPTFKLNKNIIIKKNENKNYLNTIRLIKKRDKIINKEKENSNFDEEKSENIKSNKKTFDVDYSTNKNENNTKYYENEIKPRKELAVIRRINMKIQNYKKHGPQVYQISKRHKKKLEINNEYKNNKNYHSYRKLSEIEKRPKYVFTNNNTNNNSINIGVNKSKSNRSLPKFDKYYKSFKF